MKGFSLIETIVVLGIIGLLLTIVTPLSHKAQVQNALQVATTSYGQSLRRAKALAQNGNKDSAWGVSISTSTIVLFKGTTYAGRDSSFDEQYPLSRSLSVTGVTEVDFAKFSGVPSTSGTTTITATGVGVKSISINAQGTITF